MAKNASTSGHGVMYFLWTNNRKPRHLDHPIQKITCEPALQTAKHGIKTLLFTHTHIPPYTLYTIYIYIYLTSYTDIPNLYATKTICTPLKTCVLFSSRKITKQASEAIITLGAVYLIAFGRRGFLGKSYLKQKTCCGYYQGRTTERIHAFSWFLSRCLPKNKNERY